MPILGSLGAATAKGVGFTAVPAELPGTPTIGTATVISGVAVSVSYTAPTFDGNTSILSYTAVAFNHPSGTAAGITGTAFGPNSGSVTVSGLTSGANYRFRVFATNGIGASGQSGLSNMVFTWTVPGNPTIAGAGSLRYTTGNSFVTLDFSAPVAFIADDGNLRGGDGGTPIISYTARALTFDGVFSGISNTVFQSGGGTMIVDGLIGGAQYRFDIFATNLVGDSPRAQYAGTRTITTRPDPPINVTATYTGGVSATVTFSPPANNGGSTIQSYSARAYINGVITALSGGGGFNAAQLSVTITGLTKGITYTFRVTANNGYGDSNPSADSNSITPLTVAAAPTIGTPLATSGTSVDVNFTAPTDTGGNSTYITSYTAVSTPGNISVTKTTGLPTPGTTSVINIPGLTKGQPYTFTVFATNPIGNSANSAASISVTPADVPNAPTINLVTTSTANTGTGTVIVNYSAPADNGGATITSYTAVSTPGGVTASVSTAASGTITVTGLIKGTAYTFVVFATNRVGNSANSNTSSPAITPLTVPAAPTIGTATATGPFSSTVTFTAPIDTGGTAITNYTATSTPAATITQSVTSAGVITITNGLTKGTSYTFTVAATNAIGTGANSGSSGSITTWTEPGAPTIGTATEVNATTATIAFTAGTTGGTPILNFTATAYISGVATAVTATGATSPITVSGLTQGTTYTFKVKATNSVGTGIESAASNTVQPADRPSKPTAPTVSTSTTFTADGRVTIAFTAPYDGGTTIIDYSFVSSPVTTTKTLTQTAGGTYLFTGLTKGTAYTFSYAARNRIGIGTYSDPSASITPLTVPSAPGIGTALRFDATSVNVSYSNSSDNGGTLITSYTATSTPGGITGSSLGSPILVSGLTKGTPYTFTVKANNSRGSSTESSSSNSATPATVPNAPTIGTATTINKNSASVTFTAPADNGGNTIISYTAVSSPSNISNTVTQSGSGTITITGLNPATNYTFIVYATNTYGNSANSGSSNQITTTNSYAVSASPTTINETSNRTVTFTAETIGIPNGTTVYWTNTGTTGATDFTDGINNGSFTITASGSPPVGSGTVTRTTVTDQFTEGPETVVFNLQYPSGTTQASTTVNVSDTSLTPTPTYSITEDKTSINETTNRTVTFSISTQYVINGTTLYWQLYTGVQAADFTLGSSTGSVTISGATGTPPTGGTASFSLTTTTDKLTEGPEAFFIYLGTNSPASSFYVAGSGVISLSDTSLTPGVVTISPTSVSRNIVKTGLALSVTGTFVTTMSSGTVGTIVNQPSTYIQVFSNLSISPTSRTFTAIGQTQTATWSLTTNAVDYSNTSYTASYASVLDTADGDIPNNYPTHAITLNRIAYTQNITVSPTSGFTNTTFTYTVTGAPGTQFETWNSGGGYSARATNTLNGSEGNASAGTYSESGVYWIDPGTYTVYVRWFATNHGDSTGGFSAGYATNTRVSVTVNFPAITFTQTPAGGFTGQVGSPFTGDQFAFTGTASITASGGAGGPFTYAITAGSQPSGVSFNSAGVYGGTPNTSGFYSWTITATGARSQSNTYSASAAIVAAPTMTSGYASPTIVSTNQSSQVIWTSTGTDSVALVVNGVSQGNKNSNGSFTLTFATPGDYSGTLTPRARNYSSLGAVQTFNWSVVALPTAFLSITPAAVWADGASYFSASWSSTGGVTFELIVNGVVTGFSASGSSSPGPYSDTSDVNFASYSRVTNAAGSSVNSSTNNNVVRAVPTLSASWSASTAQIVVSWSTTNTTTTTASQYITQPMANSGSQTFVGPFPDGASFSLSITATRSVSGIGSRAVTKSATITVSGSGSFS
jgi:hypothetical protein